VTNARDILYREAGPFERALAKALSDTLPVPLVELLDPSRTRPEYLPFLAAHESVDLWFDDWSEARKRRMVDEALHLAALKGTRAAIAAYLPYVDAEVIERVSYPRRFVIGRSALGLQPIGHQPFTAHLLVRVPLRRPANAMIIGRSAIARAGLRTVDQTPLRRVERAIVVSKAPETLISVNYGHRRPVTIDDGFPLDGTFLLGGYLHRKRL